MLTPKWILLKVHLNVIFWFRNNYPLFHLMQWKWNQKKARWENVQQLCSSTWTARWITAFHNLMTYWDCLTCFANHFFSAAVIETSPSLTNSTWAGALYSSCLPKLLRLSGNWSVWISINSFAIVIKISTACFAWENQAW